MRLQGKIAVVTGAARGIGLACAERFAAEGAKVVVADILDEEGAAAAAEKIGAEGGTAAFVPCDTGDAGQASALIATRDRAVRWPRYFGQQRRHRHLRRFPRGHGGGFRQGPAGQPQGLFSWSARRRRGRW